MWFLGLAILVLAYAVYWTGWKLNRVIGALGIVLERTVNRAAVNSGQPPITTKADEEIFR